MIPGIPSYSDRPIQSLSCSCGVRYVVLVGDGGNEQVARTAAERIGADFVDATRLLAFNCYCGAQIDVSPEGLITVQ